MKCYVTPTTHMWPQQSGWWSPHQPVEPMKPLGMSGRMSSKPNREFSYFWHSTYTHTITWITNIFLDKFWLQFLLFLQCIKTKSVDLSLRALKTLSGLWNRQKHCHRPTKNNNFSSHPKHLQYDPVWHLSVFLITLKWWTWWTLPQVLWCNGFCNFAAVCNRGKQIL